MTLADICASEWMSKVIAYQDETVEYLYRRGPDTEGTWIPWLVSGPSAVRRRKGNKGPGLYVAKHTVKDTVVFCYSGDVMHTPYASREEALQSSEVKKLIDRGETFLVKRSDAGWTVLDESTSSFTLVNDRRHTRPLLGINCIISDDGVLRVTRSAMPAFNIHAPLEDNIDSELRTEHTGYHHKR